MALKKPIVMSKNRFDKVDITDTAIDKVPYIEYDGIDKKYYKIIQFLAKEVLRISKEENDSNEVAITYSMTEVETLKYGVAIGTQHFVELESDTYSNHLLRTTKDLVVIHNHPSTQTFSFQDISFFFRNENIKMIIVVTNQGNIFYLCKTERYNVKIVLEIMGEYYGLLSNVTSTQEKYQITKELLKKCSKAGFIFK